jgi:hypothetical protein
MAEYEVKAAFLLNFVRLIEWPASAFSDDDTPYVLGVFADDPFQGALEAVLEGSSIAGRPLRTMRIDSPRDAQRCHLVFVPASQTKQLSTLKRAVAEAPVLLVTEGEDLARRGAAISFYQEGDRVRFEVNRQAAQRVKLKPSSRLLRLARLVEEK